MMKSTLELRQLADNALTTALNAIREMRDNELRDARSLSDAPGMDERHMRHLLCNRALIEAERLATAAREILS